MAQDDTIDVAGSWVQLTNADVTNISFQNVGGIDILVKATTTASAPSDKSGALKYPPGTGEANVALSDLFPGISGADRLYAISGAHGTKVKVSHA